MTSVLARVLLVGVAVLLAFAGGQGAATSSSATVLIAPGAAPALAVNSAPAPMHMELVITYQGVTFGHSYDVTIRDCSADPLEFNGTGQYPSGGAAVYTEEVSNGQIADDVMTFTTTYNTGYWATLSLERIGPDTWFGGGYDSSEQAFDSTSVTTRGGCSALPEDAVDEQPPDEQPDETAVDQPADAEQAEPTTDPLSAALAELFAGGGDYWTRGNDYARERTGETVYDSSDGEFEDNIIGAFHESIGSPTNKTKAQAQAELVMVLVARYAAAKDSTGKLLFPSIFQALPVFGRLAQKAADEEDPRAQLALGRFFVLLMDLDIQAGKGQ